MANATDILIVGGGIIGLTAAYRLQQAGLSVAVYERGEFGREASWAGAGILPPGNPDLTTNALDTLRAIGAVEMPRFAEELKAITSIDNGYRRNGAIEFLTEDDEYAVAMWCAERIRFERIERPSEREGALNAGLPRAYFLPDVAQVRNPWHLRALLAACASIGVELHSHSPIDSWLIHQDRVVGVRLANGEFRYAKQFLLAAGPWSEPLLNALGVRPGIYPVRGQILLLRTDPQALRHTIIAGKQYAVPRGDGSVLIGSTEEPEAGFEKRTTADGLAKLRQFVADTIPGLADAIEEMSWAGLRPGSADGWPSVGVVPGHLNVFAAVGHYRAGVQLSLGTAQFIMELITKRPPCVPPDALALDRKPSKRPRPAFRS